MSINEQTDTGVPVAAEKGLSFQGLWHVFASPGQFFGKLKDNPKVLVPYLTLFVLAFLAVLATWQYGAQLQIEQAARYYEKGILPADGIPTLEDLKLRSILIGPFPFLIPPLLSALLALLVGNFFMGGKARFKQLLSVMIYGDIIILAGFLLKVPLIWAKDSLAVGYSLAVLVAQRGVMSPLFVALDKIGVFYIWEIIVVGIGLSVMYGFSRNKGYVLSVICIGTLSLLHILMAWGQSLLVS